MGWAILCCVVFITGYAVKRLLTTAWEGHAFSLKNFFLLTVTYSVLLTGFATVFTVLTMEGIEVMVVQEQVDSFWSLFFTAVYFSTMMLFSVGNGEIIPVGLGRWVSILAIFLGHVLPVTVVWTLIYNRSPRER
ncbi:ion channel [Jeotgalibacillus marinus]|uniref:Ion channel n=1 Tax=Jeotgalibacillus marinus TaxID=86667 RepID=A0ABV3Q3W5_9BACL